MSLVTHAEAADLVYNLGKLAVDHTRSTPGATFLKPWAATWWNLLFQPKVRQKLFIKIPAKHVRDALAGNTEK